MSSYCTRDQRAYCIRSTTWHQTVNLVSSLNSNPNLSVWQMVCLVDPMIIAGSSAVCNLLHLLSSCSKEWLAERHLRGRERETERDHRRAGIDRCRGRKRDREHLSTLLPAEECLSPQAAEYETRSQLQLMAKWSICLDYIAVRFLPQRQGQKQGRKGINLRSAWPIQTLLWKFTCTARVTWYTLKKVPNILSHHDEDYSSRQDEVRWLNVLFEVFEKAFASLKRIYQTGASQVLSVVLLYIVCQLLVLSTRQLA